MPNVHDDDEETLMFADESEWMDEPSDHPAAQNHLTHPVIDLGVTRPGALSPGRDEYIRHLSTHPEHAWRYPAGYDFGDPLGEGTTGLDWAAAHRRHHEATPPRTLPSVLDTEYFMRTGQRLDLTAPGAWELEGYDSERGGDAITSLDGPVDLAAKRMLADAYPHVSAWQVRPARIDETYRTSVLAARRIAHLYGIDTHAARAILTIAATEQLGFRFAHGRFEVTGDDDDQTWRIRSVEPDPDSAVTVASEDWSDIDRETWAGRCSVETPCPTRAAQGGLSCGH